MTRGNRKEAPVSAVVFPVPRRLSLALLGLMQVYCALFFFTNLTRNPYYTQIALLYVFIALIGLCWTVEVWKSGTIALPRFPFEIPLIAFLIAAAASTAWSWISHPGLRPGIAYEGVRVWTFTLVNSVMALYLPGLFTRPTGTETEKYSIWSDLILAALWGALWLGFHSNKSLDPNANIWDSYGAILWIMGSVYAVMRTRRGDATAFFHVIFAVSFLAGVYGIMQYSGRDIIWSSLVVPYGGRPVSSFGNPNFLSSYLMMVCPVALAFGLKSDKTGRWGYFLVSAVCAVGVIVTLTRSSYIGLLATLITMAFLLFRMDPKAILKATGIALLLFVALILLFPKTPISALQSPLLRFTEIFDAIKAGHTYAPLHQRILIWSSGWDMLKLHPVVGIGWGVFELFYPFFQGKYMYVPMLATFRTHANNAHNILMELWAQVGMLGAGTAIWLFVTMTYGGFKVVRSETEGLSKFVSAALLSGVIGMVVDNFFGNVSIFFATPAFLFWWVAGALFNESKGRAAQQKILPTYGRPLLGAFALFCVFVLIYFGKRWKQEVYYFEGFRMAKIGDVVKSVKALEQAYEWFPGEVNSNYEMGNSYARYGQLLREKGLIEESKKYEQKAADAFMAALHANPGYDEIYFNLGVTYSAQGKWNEAIQNLEMSLYINPLLREAYGALSNVYLQMGDMANAAKVYERGTEVFPKDKDFWNNLGYCYSQLGQHRKSFESYKQAVLVDSSFTQGWQNLGLAARTLGETKDPVLRVPAGIQEMEAAIARRDFAAALAPAKRVAEALPDSADAHLSLGNILFYLSRLDDAEKEFLRAIELRPTFVIAHVNLGRLYQMKNQPDAARQKFKDALAVDPNDKEAQAALVSLR